MEDEQNILFVRREPDGAVTLYVDEDWAAERGANVSELVRVPIPQELYASGTVQQLREYAATYIESMGENNSSSSTPPIH